MELPSSFNPEEVEKNWIGIIAGESTHLSYAAAFRGVRDLLYLNVDEVNQTGAVTLQIPREAVTVVRDRFKRELTDLRLVPQLNDHGFQSITVESLPYDSDDTQKMLVKPRTMLLWRPEVRSDMGGVLAEAHYQTIARKGAERWQVTKDLWMAQLYFHRPAWYNHLTAVA